MCDADCLGMSNSVYGAKMNKGDFVISRGVLYHKDKVRAADLSTLCTRK